MRLFTDKTETEVDHFDPRKKQDKIQQYSNLFPADRRCNRAKGAQWPTDEEQKLGIRFLNCCEEVDYGECIFERPETGELVGTTVAARYHIEALRLNCPELCRLRKKRTRTANAIHNLEVEAKNRPEQMLPAAISAAEELKRILSDEIPLIALLPSKEG